MRYFFISVMLTFFALNPAFANTLTSPVGTWTTIDDVTNKPKSIIKITEDANHTLSGQIIKIYPKPGKDEHELCEACTGEKHNQPIVGMVIMTGFKQNGQDWENGEILDPNNGETYSCTMYMKKNGMELKVHGYIGISILGRTQTWLRILNPK